MRTRSKTIASHCVVTRVPVEVITEILKYTSVSQADLISVASTCRYLRAVASSFMFKDLSLVLEKVASFDPLQAIKTDPTKAKLVELLIIRARWQLTPVQARRYSAILASALPLLVNLKTLSIPFALLSEVVFASIYAHPTIRMLDLDDVKKANAAHVVSFDSSVDRTLRASPLSVRRITLDRDNYAFAEAFLRFLERHSIFFPYVTVIALDLMPEFLATQAPLALENVLLLAHPTVSRTAFDFVRRLAAGQPSLGRIDIEFLSIEAFDTFELGQTWPLWQSGIGHIPIGTTATARPFVSAWSKIGLSGIKLASGKLAAEYPALMDKHGFEEEERAVVRLKLAFASGAVLPAQAISALVSQIGWLKNLVIGSQVGWEDWGASAQCLLGDQLKFLDNLTLWCSFTPRPTVSTTLACSSACYAKLAKTDPSLVVDADLVGGYLAVWDIAYTVNLARVKALTGVFKDRPGMLEWALTGKGEDDVVVEVKLSGSDAAVNWERDTCAEVDTAAKVRVCYCFGCGDVLGKVCGMIGYEEGDDPVSALKKCPVDEVRAALKVIGFDLDGFDAKAPSEPVVAASLETFLRSASA